MGKSSVALHEQRIPALDGFRGLAVIAVMLYHFALPMATQENGRAWWAAMRVLTSGSCGVEMFFVLSGFLITGILLDSKSSRSYFRTFYARRILRIFPLYYGVLIVCFGLLPWLGAIKPFVSQQGWLWFYGANLAGLKGISFMPVFDHFWSLAVEEHFYFVWPLVVLLLSRRALAIWSASLAVGSLVLRCTIIGCGWTDHETAAALTPCRMDGLVIGALLAAISRGPGLASLLPWSLGMTCVGGMGMLACKSLGGASGSIWAMSGVGHYVTSLTFAGILIMAVAKQGFWSRLLSNSMLRTFGKYSYALYVFHYMIQPGLDARFWFVPSVPVLSLAIHILVMSAITLAMAMTSWHLYEKQFLKLKHRFEYDKAAKDVVIQLPVDPSPPALKKAG